MIETSLNLCQYAPRDLCVFNGAERLNGVFNWKDHLNFRFLTLSLLMSYIYGAPSKARNLMYIYGRDFSLRILLLELCFSLIYA
jgi:hypothetical protein